jgi:hypothetical protein
MFLFITASRPALEPTQPPVQWVPGSLSLELKWPEREADHSPPSSAEVKNAWSYISIPQYVFMAWCLVKYRDNFTYVEATCHVCGRVKRHNCRVWGYENPHDVTEHGHSSPKVNVWCALMKNKVVRPFLLEEPTGTGDAFVTTIQNTALRHVCGNVMLHHVTTCLSAQGVS